jgi:serine-type D-Ala-D-Ala carboxypeptidase (penicillin-binding protein 5/6)
VFRRLRLGAILFVCVSLAGASAADVVTKKDKEKKSGRRSRSSSSEAYAQEPDPHVLFQDGMPQPPIIEAKSAIVLDPKTGRVLYDKGAELRRQAASTQKLLTALIVAENGRLGEAVRVEASDTYCEPTKLGLRPGDVYRRGTLLQALLVKSANDVALCLARSNSGSIESFADTMNRKALQLGLTGSHFVNPNGLPAPGQYSTARDIARVARYAYFNPTIRNIVGTQTLHFQFADGHIRDLKNTNKILGVNPYCNGMKTGYTNAAGHCLVASGNMNGQHVIAVLMASRKAVWSDASNLLNWALGAQ